MDALHLGGIVCCPPGAVVVPEEEGNISLTLNSLDDPEAARPEMKFSANTEVSWCGLLADLPDNEMDVTSVPGFVNYQHKIGRLEVHTSEPQAFSNHGMSLSRNSNAKFILATNRIDQ